MTEWDFPLEMLTDYEQVILEHLRANECPLPRRLLPAPDLMETLPRKTFVRRMAEYARARMTWDALPSHEPRQPAEKQGQARTRKVRIARFVSARLVLGTAASALP